MFHACVRIFDVIDTVQNFLGTKQGLSFTLRALVKQTSSDTFADTILGMCLVDEKDWNCSTFRCYLTNNIQLWTN